MNEILIFCGGIALGIGASAACMWLANRIAYSQYMREKGAKGNQVKANKEERLYGAVGELVMKMKQDNKPFAEAAKEVALAYPDVALDIGKRVMSGNLPKGLGDLFGSDEK